MIFEIVMILIIVLLASYITVDEMKSRRAKQDGLPLPRKFVKSVIKVKQEIER